jgi:putative DNA methylase
MLDEVLTEQEGEYDPDTRWALAWFDQFGMDEAPFGVAETLSKAKNSSVQGLQQAGIVKAAGGKVRLLRREELPAEYDPATDTRISAWEAVQHLIRALQTQGEQAAGALLAGLGSRGDLARDLAYRLYNTCERKGWAQDALAYNSLVVQWPEVNGLAAQAPTSSALADADEPAQARLIE